MYRRNFERAGALRRGAFILALSTVAATHWHWVASGSEVNEPKQKAPCSLKVMHSEPIGHHALLQDELSKVAKEFSMQRKVDCVISFKHESVFNIEDKISSERPDIAIVNHQLWSNIVKSIRLRKITRPKLVLHRLAEQIAGQDPHIFPIYLGGNLLKYEVVLQNESAGQSGAKPIQSTIERTSALVRNNPYWAIPFFASGALEAFTKSVCDRFSGDYYSVVNGFRSGEVPSVIAGDWNYTDFKLSLGPRLKVSAIPGIVKSQVQVGLALPFSFSSDKNSLAFQESVMHHFVSKSFQRSFSKHTGRVSARVDSDSEALEVNKASLKSAFLYPVGLEEKRLLREVEFFIARSGKCH